MSKLPFLISFILTLVIIGFGMVLPNGGDSASIEFRNLSESSLNVRILEANNETKMIIAPKGQESRTVAGPASFVLHYQTPKGLAILNVPIVPKAETVVKVRAGTVSVVVGRW